VFVFVSSDQFWVGCGVTVRKKAGAVFVKVNCVNLLIHMLRQSVFGKFNLCFGSIVLISVCACAECEFLSLFFCVESLIGLEVFEMQQ
jgi:hypothetical protein